MYVLVIYLHYNAHYDCLILVTHFEEVVSHQPFYSEKHLIPRRQIIVYKIATLSGNKLLTDGYLPALCRMNETVTVLKITGWIVLITILCSMSLKKRGIQTVRCYFLPRRKLKHLDKQPGIKKQIRGHQICLVKCTNIEINMFSNGSISLMSYLFGLKDGHGIQIKRKIS